MPSSMPTKPTPISRTAKICYAWNHSSEAACPFPNCAYQHICLYCANDNQIIPKNHKSYTARAGGAMALEAIGNLLLPPPTDHNREPPTATSPTKPQEPNRPTLFNEPYSVLTLSLVLSHSESHMYILHKNVYCKGRDHVCVFAAPNGAIVLSGPPPPSPSPPPARYWEI